MYRIGVYVLDLHHAILLLEEKKSLHQGSGNVSYQVKTYPLFEGTGFRCHSFPSSLLEICRVCMITAWSLELIGSSLLR